MHLLYHHRNGYPLQMQLALRHVPEDANEADVLNMALFGMTAKQWRDGHPDIKGNMRDYATINELAVLSNLQTHNAELIREGKEKEERFTTLLSIAQYQIRVLNEADKIHQTKKELK